MPADHMNEGLEHIRASQDALKSALGDPNEIKLALEQMAKGIGQLGDGTVAFSEAMEHLRDGWQLCLMYLPLTHSSRPSKTFPQPEPAPPTA